MDWLLDLHTHTVASGHAYSTLKENIEAAKEKGLKVLGMSEHGSAMPGSAYEYYFWTYGVIPNEIMGVRVLKGIEANIMDEQGTLDIPEHIYRCLDYVIASMHLPCYSPGTVEQNTQAFLHVMDNPHVRILGHINDGTYPVDLEAIIQKAKAHSVFIELNNATLLQGSIRKNGIEIAKNMLELCKIYQVPMIVGSDAHIHTCVGNFKAAQALMKEVYFPEELVVNGELDIFEKYIKL